MPAVPTRPPTGSSTSSSSASTGRPTHHHHNALSSSSAVSSRPDTATSTTSINSVLQMNPRSAAAAAAASNNNNNNNAAAGYSSKRRGGGSATYVYDIDSSVGPQHQDHETSNSSSFSLWRDRPLSSASNSKNTNAMLRPSSSLDPRRSKMIFTASQHHQQYQQQQQQQQINNYNTNRPGTSSSSSTAGLEKNMNNHTSSSSSSSSSSSNNSTSAEQQLSSYRSPCVSIQVQLHEIAAKMIAKGEHPDSQRARKLLELLRSVGTLCNDPIMSHTLHVLSLELHRCVFGASQASIQKYADNLLSASAGGGVSAGGGTGGGSAQAIEPAEEDDEVAYFDQLEEVSREHKLLLAELNAVENTNRQDQMSAELERFRAIVPFYEHEIARLNREANKKGEEMEFVKEELGSLQRIHDRSIIDFEAQNKLLLKDVRELQVRLFQVSKNAIETEAGEEMYQMLKTTKSDQLHGLFEQCNERASVSLFLIQIEFLLNTILRRHDSSLLNQPCRRWTVLIANLRANDTECLLEEYNELADRREQLDSLPSAYAEHKAMTGIAASTCCLRSVSASPSSAEQEEKESEKSKKKKLTSSEKSERMFGSRLTSSGGGDPSKTTALHIGPTATAFHRNAVQPLLELTATKRFRTTMEVHVETASGDDNHLKTIHSIHPLHALKLPPRSAFVKLKLVNPMLKNPSRNFGDDDRDLLVKDSIQSGQNVLDWMPEMNPDEIHVHPSILVSQQQDQDQGGGGFSVRGGGMRSNNNNNSSPIRRKTREQVEQEEMVKKAEEELTENQKAARAKVAELLTLFKPKKNNLFSSSSSVPSPSSSPQQNEDNNNNNKTGGGSPKRRTKRQSEAAERKLEQLRKEQEEKKAEEEREKRRRMRRGSIWDEFRNRFGSYHPAMPRKLRIDLCDLHMCRAFDMFRKRLMIHFRDQLDLALKSGAETFDGALMIAMQDAYDSFSHLRLQCALFDALEELYVFPELVMKVGWELLTALECFADSSLSSSSSSFPSPTSSVTTSATAAAASAGRLNQEEEEEQEGEGEESGKESSSNKKEQEQQQQQQYPHYYYPHASIYLRCLSGDENPFFGNYVAITNFKLGSNWPSPTLRENDPSCAIPQSNMLALLNMLYPPGEDCAVFRTDAVPPVEPFLEQFLGSMHSGEAPITLAVAREFLNSSISQQEDPWSMKISEAVTFHASDSQWSQLDANGSHDAVKTLLATNSEHASRIRDELCLHHAWVCGQIGNENRLAPTHVTRIVTEMICSGTHSQVIQMPLEVRSGEI